MRSILFACLVSMCLPSANLFADAVITPSDLDPGDKYRLVFVTSGMRDATSTSIADYNTFVDQFGDLALQNDWRVIGSTATVDAINNTNTPTTIAGIPIYRLDGTRVVDDYAHLWSSGNLLASINTYENGATADCGFAVGTGTGSSGVKNEDFELGGIVKTRRGNCSHVVTSWIAQSTSSASSDYRFYGISEVLTVAVPEPSSLTALWATGLLMFRRRRTR